jgi:hypothetical protein
MRKSEDPCTTSHHNALFLSLLSGIWDGVCLPSLSHTRHTKPLPFSSRSLGLRFTGGLYKVSHQHTLKTKRTTQPTAQPTAHINSCLSNPIYFPRFSFSRISRRIGTSCKQAFRQKTLIRRYSHATVICMYVQDGVRSMRCSVTESHLIALTRLISGTLLRHHAFINGVSSRSGLWCEKTRDVVRKALVHECFRDRRLGGMRGLSLGIFCGHIAVQIPMMHLHQRHALVSAVQGLEASHHGYQTLIPSKCEGVAFISLFDVPVDSRVS